jgi:hypothetical protein
MVYFQTKNTNYVGFVLEGLGMENVGIFTSFSNVWQPFGTFWGHLVPIYFPVLECCTKKHLATLCIQDSVTRWKNRFNLIPHFFSEKIAYIFYYICSFLDE